MIELANKKDTGENQCMKNILFDHGYKIEWNDVYIERKKRYKTSASEFHEHDFYEINLILSGNVKVLLANRSADGTESKIVLTRPNTTHFISCKPDIIYSSIYLVFTDEFIKSLEPEFSQLLSVFGEKGNIIPLTEKACNRCKRIINNISEETNFLRKKLLVFYLLSYISGFEKTEKTALKKVPPYISSALSYINKHYNEKIIASELATKLHVGRTTLMTSFKAHTGSTLNDYIVYCRLKHVIMLLREGKSEQEIAELCGFGDASSLIQCFKRKIGVTPIQYLSQKKDNAMTEQIKRKHLSF